MGVGTVDAAKRWFFDSEAVVKAVEKEKRKLLSKAGAFVRQRARSAIRKRKKVSEPGGPPSSHEGSLRSLLFFAYDPQTGGVVVGPAKLNSSPADPPVPHLLEFGGTAVVRGAGSRRRGYKYRVGNYRPRPFMGPALEAEAPKFAELFRGSLKG